MNFLKYKSVDEKLVYISIGIITLIVLVAGLFPETTSDSAKYAAVSRNIFESGDLIHLKIHGEPYMQKPPLLFWFAAFFFKIFGVSIFAFKLPNLLFSFLGCYSVYRLGILIYNKRTGIIAAILYTANESFLLYNMDVHTDLLLTSFIIFATWQIAEYLNNKNVLNFILGFIGLGLAMISKGFIGLIVPLFAIAGYLMVKRDFRAMFSLKWLAGIPVLIIILYPALKGLYDQFGMSGIKFYFWSN
jgi:4-amino-4-deoxy-L-arabinose transferase-like glycosyltransferase